MLLSLLSSEAMVDSRDYEVLSAEEVEEFKKVRAYLVFQFRRSHLHGDHLSAIESSLFRCCCGAVEG
jgi:hypothetical protein